MQSLYLDCLLEKYNIKCNFLIILVGLIVRYLFCHDHRVFWLDLSQFVSGLLLQNAHCIHRFLGVVHINQL